MKKNNTMRLTEAQLHSVIKESVTRILKEGHWDSKVYDKFEKVREMVGDDILITELYNWLESDSIERFIEHMNRYHELGLGSDEEEYDDFEDEEY